MNLQQVVDYLKGYNGRALTIMEVCGTHTSAIFNNGIRSLISPKIRLVSGPGCPVCVTPTSYIDKCIEYSLMPGCKLITFGDMVKVPGAEESLASVKGEGAAVELMYTPLEVIRKAEEHPDITYIIAAVGFETTVPAYGLAMDEILKKDIKNVKLLTSLKTVMPALEWLCGDGNHIDGFLCPGHVSVIIGSKPYEKLAQQYNKPFVIGGFEGEHILAAIYHIVRQVEEGTGIVENLYTNAVKPCGNEKALAKISQYFRQETAVWRGLGDMDASGLYLKEEYALYDSGSRGLTEDARLNSACCCDQVITGRINPDQCPLFGAGCTPSTPHGPCMVSEEGACGIWHKNR